jgi:hypothetical protein
MGGVHGFSMSRENPLDDALKVYPFPGCRLIGQRVLTF